MKTNFTKTFWTQALAALMIATLLLAAMPTESALAAGPVAPLDAWPSTPQMTGTTSNPANFTFTISSGTERLLLVAIASYDNGGSSGQTFSATYGGKALTQAFIENSDRRQTWIGYLKGS